MTNKRDYRQSHEMEMVQLSGNLNELDEILKQWTKGNITDKEFALKAQNIITFLKAVTSEISTTFQGLFKSEMKTEKEKS